MGRAYEIKTIHNKEPPPKEILENLTAKGGDLLSRTVETFKGSTSRDSYGAQDSDGSSGEEIRTPKDERMDIDDPGSGAGRSTRGLRQAPPPRVLFQPDTSSSRQTRHGSANQQSPQPSSAGAPSYNGYGATSNSPHFTGSLANYEPRPQMPLTLRPVMTPGNNVAQFEADLRREREMRRTQLGINFTKVKDGMMKPGAGFDGPNIYVRTLQGLRSGLPEEENYALHHLVKISHERGDKYKFEAFPNLAEGLLEYALRVSSLFYDVRWEISYFNDEVHDLNVLNGIYGTPDILERIQCLNQLDPFGGLETWEEAQIATKVHEAALTIRNLCLLEENAIYLSGLPVTKDFLTIALNLPPNPLVTEFRHYALDICEQLTKYWRMGSDDPLYRSLLSQVEEGRDRGAIITALRALSRISMHLEDPNRLQGVPFTMLRQLSDYLSLNDDELTQASLEFVFIFTGTVDNVLLLLANPDAFDLSDLLHSVTGLLQHHSIQQYTKRLTEHSVASAEAKEIPSVPEDLMQEFLQLKEPERSNQWLRSVFEEKADSEITQIALWQAYQTLFTEHASAQEPLLPAADFIKNVSTIFTNANAQIVPGPPQKFVIRGIRPRHGPTDIKGRTYTRCLWAKDGSDESKKPEPCGHFAQKPKQLYGHIARDHINLPTTSDGEWDFQAAKGISSSQDCLWSGCRHFSWTQEKIQPSPYELAMHVKTHLQDVGKKALMRAKNNRTIANQTTKPTASMTDLEEEGREESSIEFSWIMTATNDRHDPAGIPLISLLLLRNMARMVPKAVARLVSQNGPEQSAAQESSRVMQELFMPLWERFFTITAFDLTMRKHISGLQGHVQREMDAYHDV